MCLSEWIAERLGYPSEISYHLRVFWRVEQLRGVDVF
jgi:hypothetical protein